MSNRLQYDPLLTAYLAAELDRELRGRGCAAAPFFAPDLSVTLPLADGRELRADLHPGRGWITLRPAADADDELDAVCLGVSTLPDERVVRIDIQVIGRFQEQRRALILELPTNQWNAVVTDDDGRITQVLRARRAGARTLFPGNEYVAPPAGSRHGVEPADREGARALWERTVEAVPAAERRGCVVRTFAWTGTVNAGWILDGAGADERFRRWWWLAGRPPAEPVLLETAAGPLPYPVPLEGWAARPCGSLLDAMASLAEAGETPREERGEETAAAEALVRRRIAAAERKLESLRQEMARAGEGERLRAIGGLILGKIREVRRGATGVRLDDWEGRPIEIALDPTLGPAENAAAYFDEARRRDRAEARLPDLIGQAGAEITRWNDILAEVEAGRVPTGILEEARARSDRRGLASAGETSLPYRLFRTSGGLEVRVGRGARENDRLTFRESAPNDVWLHARSVPGSHVILRWPQPEGSPPARDLAEAAQLAALFSRARSSGLVAVDWTRRKHVRKPRGAPPGLVIPQRVKTLFVEPDATLPERLKEF